MSLESPGPPPSADPGPIRKSGVDFNDLREATKERPLKAAVQPAASEENLIDDYVAEVFEALPDLCGVAFIDLSTSLVVSQRTRSSVNWSAFAVSARLILEGFSEVDRISFQPIQEELFTVQVVTSGGFYILNHLCDRFSIFLKFPHLEGSERALSIAELSYQVDRFKTDDKYALLRSGS